ncbi:MAG TPA: DUF4446 family protein [Solirubrobacterales bacterium]|nr:DUF4446 family protein [Solirubrobacterales bacterium]
MSDLGSTAGTAALIAGGIALVALLLAVMLAVRLRRLRRDQLAVLGDGAPSDLVAHARDMQRGFAALEARVEELSAQTSATARRLEGAITHCAVVRYDAYDEMSGRQSSSVAMLDDHRNGVVLSSILQREQARLYAKGVTAGRSELGLSPEEQAALDAALSNDRD